MPSRPARLQLPFWCWAALPFLAAGWLRARHIGLPEPFVDESGNILVALDPRVRALIDPLGQGRPLLAGLFAPAGWFPDYALVVARLMTAGAGLLTMAGLGWMLLRLAGRTAALLGLWLWALMPFAVFHERLVLQDPFVAAALAWSAALLVRGGLAEKTSAGRWFFAAGACFGVALLLKISAVFALPWLGLLHAGVRLQARQPLFPRALAWVGAGVILPLLGLGAGVLHLAGRTGHFSSLPSFAADNYWALAGARLQGWVTWYAGYGGWPLGLLVMGALILALRHRAWPALGCILGAGLALFIAALFYNRPFARYLLPEHVPLVLGLALGWAEVFAAGRRFRVAAAAAFGLALAGWGLVAWQIGRDPRSAAVPRDEIAQYFTGPWSGRGVNELHRYLADYADRHHVRCLVLTHRFTRPGCYGLMLAELADARISVLPFTVYDPPEFAAALQGVQHVRGPEPLACFLLYEGSLYPAPAWFDQPGTPVLRVQDIPRGEGESFSLYRFEPL